MSPSAPTKPLLATRQPCPPGACDCGWLQRAQLPAQQARIFWLTPDALQDLVQRLASAPDLAALRHLLQRMHAQLGLQVQLAPGRQGTQGLKGLVIDVQPQPCLCRKTRQAIAAAIRSAMHQRPHIAMAMLNENSLFG